MGLARYWLLPAGLAQALIPMKSCTLFIQTACVFATGSVHGQGTFIYDQQSADENTGGGAAGVIQANQPIGQSFVPTLSSVGFIRLSLSDSAFNGIGATVYVNLRENSITGNILAASTAVFMPDRFSGYTDFFFSAPVTVVSEATYFFQPVLQSGDNTWAIIGYHYNYPRGTAFGQGMANPASDLWFREGIVVPEPGSCVLFVIGCGLLVWRKRLVP